ncbi:unnamed protein product [Closterium sp. Naga37s-1]|nr:unnamed protein product [Closterium sp. Naga37s-1]
MASTNSNAGGVEGNNSHADLEASVQKIDLNNMDEEMAEKDPGENSPAKDPPAAENSKGQEEESQEDDIELEGEDDILHAELAKLQDHAVEKDTRIQLQQSLITNLTRELSDQDNKIKYLEVELKNMKHDAREHVHQMARQTSKTNELREAFSALRRETMYRPAPRADPHANSASGRTNPSRSGGVAGDPDLLRNALLSRTHDARVVAATTVLDQNAQRVVYGSKIQAEVDRKPFGWEEFASALKQAFQVQPTQLEVRIRLEKLQCGNRTVQQYDVEFEEIWVLQKPAERMSEGDKIHLFFRGLPEHLQNMQMTDGAGEAWRSYDHVKRVVGTTDKHFRAYAKTTTQPQQAPRPSSSPAGPSGRQQGMSWKGRNHKRPFQRGQQADHKAKKVNEGGPSNVQSCFKCGKPGHKGYECRHRKSVKYSGKPKTDNRRNDGSGPSGSQRDFAKPN